MPDESPIVKALAAFKIKYAYDFPGGPPPPPAAPALKELATNANSNS